MIIYANHGVRFILELISILAIGYFVFKIQNGIIIKYGAGVGIVLIIIVIWSYFGSPSAPYRLQGLSRLALEMVIYSVAFAAITFTVNMKWALIYGVFVIINTILLYKWG